MGDILRSVTHPNRFPFIHYCRHKDEGATDFLTHSLRRDRKTFQRFLALHILWKKTRRANVLYIYISKQIDHFHSKLIRFSINIFLPIFIFIKDDRAERNILSTLHVHFICNNIYPFAESCSFALLQIINLCMQPQHTVVLTLN